MHDRFRALLGENACEQFAIRNIAFIQRHAIGHGEFEARCQIVDHRDLPTAIKQGKNRVAADIAGTAGDEDGCLSAHGRKRLA